MTTLRSIEPATGAVLWEGEAGDVEDAVARAAAGWPRWATQPLAYRIEAVRRFANIVRSREALLADSIARETGRPLWDAKVEVAAVVDGVEQAIAAYSNRTGQKRIDAAMGARQTLRHKPRGVLAVVTAYSGPALLPAHAIVPALVAGNAVVFKPSEAASATGLLLAGLFHEAGVPKAALVCVPGGPEAGKALCAHPDIAGVLFAGSARAGIAINRASALRPDRSLLLEMGGNNPMILWDAPDLPAAINLAVQSAFLSSGQRCTAGRRLIVREGIADRAIAALVETTGRLIVDTPHADPAPYLGPMIDMEAADGLTESFLFLMSHGGRPLTHMRRPVEGLPFVTPGIIDVTDMPERPDIELFGPILQVVRVADFDAAIQEANATRFARCAALFGGTEQQFEQFWLRGRAGAINWNRPTHLVGPSLPMGGGGLSGNARAGGAYTADACAAPVVSAEIGQPRASIGVGMRALEIVADR